MSNKNKKSDPPPKRGRTPRFPELPPKYSSSRELRNKAEKIRRNRLNKLVEEMHSLVPIICNKTNKSEKTRTNILRLTANYLKVSQMFPKKSSIDSSILNKTELIGEGIPHLEAMEGFFFILAEDGKILFVSENVEKFIGFSQVDMMGVPIYHFTHTSDHKKMQSNLSKRESTPSHSPSPSPPISSQSSSNSMALARLSSSNGSGKENKGPRQSFYIRIREKPLTKHDDSKYEHMHIMGHLRKTEDSSLGKYTFVGVMKPMRDRPITELSLMESIQDQYITRHLPDGRIIYTDHRISTIAGYLPSVVKGKSAFNFFFAEDLPWTTMAMRHMFASSNGEGTTVYRLFTQTGELICLQTKGFLEFNKTTNKIESFLCINTVINPDYAEQYLNEQKERFTPFITELQIDAIKSSQQPYGLTTLSLDQCETNASVIASARTPKYSDTSHVPVDFEHNQISLKRKMYPLSPESLDNEPLSKKSFTHKSITNTNLPQKRVSEEANLQNPKVPRNWQYTPAREEPMHRNEDGIRVVDIDQQLFPDGNSCFPRQDHPEKSQINFQGLINQLNKSYKAKNLLETNITRNSSSTSLTDQMIAKNPQPATATKVGRTSSVIKMLPKTNLKPVTEKDYVPREVDIIRQEMLNTSTSQADRIAEKLKVMLAPLAGQQSRIVDGRTQANTSSEDITVTAAVYANASTDMFEDSDLLEILDQDLLFSTESQYQNNRDPQFPNDKLSSKSS